MNDRKEADRWLPRDHPEYHREEPFKKPYQEDGHRCWRLWRSAVVNWDGGLAPCCYLTDKVEDFGDVSVNTIEEIWNNSNYTTARGLFKEGYKPEQLVGCVSCSVYTGSRAARKRGPVALRPEPVYVSPTGLGQRNDVGASRLPIPLVTETVGEETKE